MILRSVFFSFLLLLFFPFIPAGRGQHTTGKRYQCSFRDTVAIHLPDSLFQQLTVEALEKDNGPLTDSAKQELGSQLKMNFALAGPLQIQQRKVDASDDSTIVYFDGIENKGLKTNLPYKKMILLNGRKIKEMYNDRNELINIPDHSNRKFVATGEYLSMLGYRCAKFQSQDGNLQIWITTSLPSSINPGIANVDVPGAILRFVIRNPQQTISSSIVDIR